MKKLIIALVCLLAPLGVRAQVSVTGNLKNVGVENATGSNTYAKFLLINYGATIPRVLSTNVITNPVKEFHPDLNGNISGTIQGNDSITPGGTTYQVCIFYQGTQFRCATYSITGSSFNLNTAVPLASPPPSTQLIYGSKSFIFTQISPATTWTIIHSFGDKNATVQCRDLNDYVLIPDRIFLTDHNTTTVTFVTAQAGTCIALTAGNTVFTTAIGDAALKNPNSTQTFNGQTIVFTGPVLATKLNGTVFADQMSGADAAAKIQAAITGLPSAGGTVDARNLTDVSGTGSVAIDPGAKAVTLLLGPYTYTISQLILRSSLHVIGAGDGQSGGGGPMTVLQSCTTCTATAPIVMGTGTAPYPIQSVILEGFRLYAAPSNTTQVGISIVAGSGGGGLWYSTFRNLCVGACGPGLVSFKGGNIIFDGTAGGSPNGVNQFNDFISIKSFRSAGGSYAFQAKGQNAQFTFKNPEFDGPAQSDSTAANLWLGDGVGGLSTPLTTFSFDELTCQTSAVCASINGAWDITFHQTHVEQISGAFQLTQGATNGNIGIGIDHSYFAVNAGVNGGSGYLVKGVSGTNAVTFSDNYMISTPDAICAGACTNVLNGINNFGFGGNSNNNNAAANIIASTLQVANIQSNQAAGLANGNIVLDAGFGTGASISGLQTPWSTGQTANFVINVGTGPTANPTLTVTFPAGFNTPVLCTLDQHGGTHAFSLFAHTTVSASNAVFTFAGTPTTGNSLQVVMRCGP